MSIPTDDTLATIRLVISAMRCLESQTLSDASRIGICLDIVGTMRELLDTCLTSILQRLVNARDIHNEAWTALADLEALVSTLPQKELSWIESAVGWLKLTETP